MAKILSKCALCKRPIWINIIKDKVTRKKVVEKEPHCQNCKNLMSKIKQEMVNRGIKEKKKIKKKGYIPDEVPEPDIKSEVQKLIRREQQQKAKEAEGKPLNISKSTIKSRKGKASNE